MLNSRMRYSSSTISHFHPGFCIGMTSKSKHRIQNESSEGCVVPDKVAMVEKCCTILQDEKSSSKDKLEALTELKGESNLVDFTPIDKLKSDLNFWIELILPLLYSFEPKELREAVMNCFDIINIHSSEYCETESFNKFKEELKTKYIPVMVKLAEVSSPDWDRLWCFSLDLLKDFIQKKECHAILNGLLVVVEKAFKATDTHTRMNAFTCWQHLITKFLSNGLDDLDRKVKLLLMPLIASNTKTPELSRKKLDVWWHLVRRLEGRRDYLERVVVPFLNYCFGPLKETPFPSYQKTTLLGSPGKREPSNHQACISAMFGILSRNPRRKEDGDLLDPLPVVLLQSPESFLKISRPVIHSVGECTLLMIINKGEESRVRQLWALLMCHINSVLQSLSSNSISVDKVVEMVKDVLRVIMGLLDLVKTSENFLPLAPLIVNPILDLLVNGPYPLPCWVLMSQVYYVGSAGLMSGTPALMVVDMLFSPTLLSTRSLSGGSKHHMFVLKAVLKMAISPRSFTLDFVLALMKRIDTASNESYLDSWDAFLVWGVVVRALIRFLEKDGELNQGNNLVHDFSTLYAVLIFPLQHVHEAENSQVSELMRLWSHLFKIFNTNANMVATIEVNEVGEHLCSKMMTIVKKSTLTMTQLITLAHALKDIVNVIPYGAIDNVTPKKGKSTNFLKKLQEKPLQNISNVLHLLTTLAECLKIRSSLDSCNLVGASLAQAMSVIFAKMTTSPNIVPLVSKLSEAVHTILKLPSKPSAGWGEMNLQVFQLFLSFTKFVEIVMNKVGLAKLVTHITPSIEAAFRHHSNKLRNITIRFWSDILSPAFAKDSVTIPPNLMQAFEKSLLEDNDMIPEDDTENSMNIISGIPKLSGTLMSKNTGSKRLSPLKPNPSTPILVSQTTPISHQSGSEPLTWDCKIASVSVMKNPVPVLISTATPLRSRPLTVHQKEMMRKRRDDIPAMYMDLTQDTQTQFTEESQSQDISVEAISRNNREAISSVENQQANLVTTFTDALSSQITKSNMKTKFGSEMSTSQSPISANASEQSKTLPAASGSLQSTLEAHNNTCNDTFHENDVIPSSQQMPESTILKQNVSDRNQSIISPKETISETVITEKMAMTKTPLDKTPPKTCSGDDSVTPETSPGQSFPSFASPRSRALMSSMKLMSPSCLSLIKRNNIRTNSNRSAQILDMTRALDVDNPKSDISHDKLDLDNSSAEHRENESLASRLMKKKKIALPAKDRLLMYSSGGRLLELDYKRHNYSADASPSSSNLKRRLEEEDAEQTCSPPKKKRVSFTDPPRSLELHFNQTLAEMSLRHRSFSEKEMPTMIKRRLGFISRRLTDNLMNYEDESEETPTKRACVPSQVNHLDNNSNNVDSEDLSQGSVVETLSTQFNEVDSIYPSLVHCQHPIESLVPLLVEPMWTNQLTKTFHNRLISTVGDLALQTEAIVNTFPLKEPKIQRVRTKLQEYEKEFMEINERKVQVTTEISGIEMLPTTLNQVTSVSSPCKSDDSVEEMCRQILQKKSANEALKIMLDQISGSNNTDEFTSLPPGVGDVIAERWSISAVMSHYLDRAKKYPSPSTSQLKQEMFDFITMQFSKGEFFKSIANRSENHPNILKYFSDEKLLSEVMVRKSLQRALLDSDIISQWDIETIFDKCITTFGVERVFRGLCNAHKIELSVKGFVILRFLCQKLGPDWICKQLDKGDVVKFLVKDMGSETIFDHIPLPQFISWVSKNDKLWKSVTAKVKEADKNSHKIDSLEERLENILDEIAPKSILEKIPDDVVIQYTMSHLNLADKLGVALNSIEKELEESVPKELAMELICALSHKLGHWRVIPKLMNLVNPLEKCDKI
uniref:(California timema) hypothetical protein n=1 Tax=Timema californicum TaxID=61474 RepID=A0A7R9J874_TIMCA|nr:unnamed protein product [Timema californicum]